MKKIGLIGEDPNDTEAIKCLLQKLFPKEIKFKPLLKNIRGGHLDNPRTSHSLKIEVEEYQPNIVIFIRDADAIITEPKKIKKVTDWFEKMNQAVKRRGILLMNIYELEALILADINTFNRLYKTNITFANNVMYQEKPKEFLMQKTAKGKKKYSESDCPEIFKHLQHEIILQNCNYFNDFNSQLKKRLSDKK